MKSDLNAILDECIQAIEAGESIDNCLSRFPDHKEELYPLLLTASSVRELPLPQGSAAAIQASRQRMLSAYDLKSQTEPVSKSIFSRYSDQVTAVFTGFIGLITGKEKNPMMLKSRLMVALALVAVLIVTTGGVTAASAGSLPGDMLYPVKKSAESVQLLLTLDREAQQELEIKFQENRINELQAVLDDGRNVEVEFYGELTEIGEDYLVVGGFTVLLDEYTEITGVLELGMLVEVEAQAQEDGTLLVSSVSIEDMDGDIEDSTENPEPTEIPDVDDDDDDDHDTPDPDETEESEADYEPTDTPTPGDDDDDDDDDNHDTPDPGETEESEDDYEPTDTPTPGDDDDDDDDTPSPGETEEPEETDEPYETPTPGDDDDDDDDDSPSPGETEEPEETDEPSETPTPGDDDDDD